jgi:uncharacterized protein YgbK (DUF1537 family)
VVREAAEAIQAACPRSEVVLRGDSTLRAHFLAEHLAVRDGLYAGREAPMLLVPALPEAGRVTLGGRHWLIRQGARTPLELTEFSNDGVFSYTTGRLLDWAQERSGRHFAAADGEEVTLAELRGPAGSAAIADALERVAARGRPGVVAPDVETQADLKLIAQGLRLARARGTDVIVRCAPAFVGALAGTMARGLSRLPPAPRGVLVVVGSHVPTTTRQLAVLKQRHASAFIEVVAGDLADATSSATAAAAAADAALARLYGERLAIVATSRETVPGTLGFAAGMRVARGLASIVNRVHRAADVVVSKGGITSAVNVAEGLGASHARVVGPVASGISLWDVSGPDGTRPFIVFPGNVGCDAALADLVDQLLEV